MSISIADVTFSSAGFTVPKPSQFLTFSSAVTINMETLDITIHEGVTIPEAARAFWNGVALVMGKPPLFPETAKP